MFCAARSLNLEKALKSLERKLAICLCAFFLAALGSFSCGEIASAQTYIPADMAYTPTAGTFVYNGAATPPTYSTSGAGSGFSNPGADQLTFARTTAAGNTEIRGRITSQSVASTNAYTGLMMRESDIAQACGMASIGVTVGGTISFTYRPQNNNSSVTVTGPAVTLPVYVRLVKSGDTITGYYSQSDPENFTSLGSYTQTNIMPKLYYVGFCSSSTTSTLNTGVMDYVSYMTSVPQPSSDLLLWLRGDLGVTGTTAISSWADQSGNGRNATQSTGALKPALVTGVLNNSVLPSLSFSGTQYLNLAADYAALSNGCSMFIVLKPSSAVATGDPAYFGNTSDTDSVFSQCIGTQASLTSYNSTTSSTVTTTTNPLSTSQYKLLELTLQPGATAGTGTGTIYVNGSQVIQKTTMQNPANVTRNNCFIGSGVGATNIFNGNIAEVILYSNVNASTRAMVESYVLSKYGIGSAPTLNAPTFSPKSGAIVLPGQTLVLNQDQGATVYFTSDGSAPNSSSSQWLGANPITLNKSQTVNAVAIAPFFNNSSVASGVFKVDATTLPVPRSGLQLWLRSDANVTSSSGAISNWGDASGLGNDASQTVSGNRPTLVSNALNNLPAVNFAASQYFQIPAGMSDFSSGLSILAVVKPTSVTAGARVLDFGNGTAANNLLLQLTSSTGAALSTYNVSSPTSVTASSAITLNKFQMLEATSNNAGTATIFTDAVQQSQSTTMNSLLNTLRSNNYVGQASGGGNNYIGQIVELLVYNRELTSLERTTLEGFLLTRTQGLLANSTPAPVFSVATSTLAAPAQVAIEGPTEASFFYTVDGTTPSTTSTPYVGPVNIAWTQTLKAIAVMRGVQSGVTTATYTLDSTKYPAPGAGTTPLQLDLQLPNQSIPQDNNQR
ncbi:MAG: chitobiase/beta-hexosaminidase C-terminal domain-containing protein [Cyanobacteria bacterium SZAS-4]|nr:chitobiase/beta-hexosaminidase C-terminal domain-containing protein [Cyanobacteria bacterium SZAS-4]